MSTLVSDPQFRLYALCCIVLSFQMLFLAGFTAATRAKNKGYMNPEDVKVAFREASLVEGAEHPATARVQRAHRNLNESLPIFFAIGLIAVLSGASPQGVQVALITFTVARVLHSIVYINALQPWRTMCYGIGTLSLLAMMVMTGMTLKG